MDGGLNTSAGEMKRIAEVVSNTYTHYCRQTQKAHALDKDTAAVKAITMIQTCQWEMV